jgi:hypothetical protein
VFVRQHTQQHMMQPHMMRSNGHSMGGHGRW